jgi:nucleotide-binding universal stress UspA family protein
VTTRRVVVGADGTPESLPVIEFAFASLRGLRLAVLHVYWDAVAAVAGLRGGPEEVVDQPDVEELRVALSQSVAGSPRSTRTTSVSLHLQHELVDEVLTPRGQGRDLVVVGRHPMDSLGRMLIESMATAVLARGHNTVAVVPEAGERHD